MSESLQTLLNREIPLTNAIGIEVVSVSDQHLSLRAPLEKNTNHKSTAFGGSLYSVAVLTGWGLVHQLLETHQLSGYIVIQQSHCDFLLPVKEDLVSYCCFDSANQLERFLTTYRRRGRARLKLQVTIQQDNQTALSFIGHYVIHK